MFRKVLIANRGAIACRILRTLKKMGIASVCVYSEADADSRHVLDADEAYCIGPAPAAQSYLSVEKILAVARESGAEAVHPGYGFLSENIGFAQACAAAGIMFIGPGVDSIQAFALKHTARAIAVECGVPLLPGTGLLRDRHDALESAARLGYPVMLKSSAGGGGIGMRQRRLRQPGQHGQTQHCGAPALRKIRRAACHAGPGPVSVRPKICTGNSDPQFVYAGTQSSQRLHNPAFSVGRATIASRS